MNPNETDVQFLARMMLGAHVPAGVSAGDSSRLYELAYPDTPAPVEERTSGARWRPEVVWFADQMERKLRDNDHKGGWHGDTLEDLAERAEEELVELHEAIEESSGADVSRVIDEAADVANMVMMVADNARRIAPVEEREGSNTELFRRIDKLREEHADALCDQAERIISLEAKLLTARTERDSTHDRAVAAEAEAAELREQTKSLQDQVNRAYDKLGMLKEDYDNLAGGFGPGFGVDPKDSSRLSDLQACIDEHGVFPSEEAEDAGDYEAAIRHMGEVCQERSCLFSESKSADVHQHEWADAFGRLGLLGASRFYGKHCRITVEALCPIGEAAEVSKPEGKDA